MSEGRLSGQVAVVTGAARGIGRAIATRYAAEGARVVVADISDAGAEDAVAEITAAGGGALGLVADVSRPAEVDRLFQAAVQEYGTVDVLVNNAAETGMQRHFFDGDDEWWAHFIRTNLTSQYLCLDRAARIMARKGSGSVINLSSGGATRAHRGMVAYDAAKGGVEALTRAAALDLAPYGIRVNALVPGLIATDPREPEQSRRRRDHTVPLGRGGSAADLAGPAVFLASAESGYVTGSRIVVDGGVLSQQRSPQVDTLPPGAYPDPAEV